MKTSQSGRKFLAWVPDDHVRPLEPSRSSSPSVRFERTPGGESCWYPKAGPSGERGRLLGGFCARASHRNSSGGSVGESCKWSTGPSRESKHATAFYGTLTAAAVSPSRYQGSYQ